MGVELAATHSLPVQCITMFGLPQNHHDDDDDDDDGDDDCDDGNHEDHTQPTSPIRLHVVASSKSQSSY